MSGRWRAVLALLPVLFLVGLLILFGTGGRRDGTAPPSASSVASPSATASGDGSASPTGASPSSIPPSGSAPAGPSVTWERLSVEGVAPVARQGATWTVDPSSDIAYLYGGTSSGAVGGGSGGATLGDLWAYDLAADAWEPVVGTSDEPPPRSGHVAAWVEDVGLVVIGGRDAEGKALGDAWRFDPSKGSWARIHVSGTLPPARFEACGAAPGDGTFWLSHGASGDAQLADTWRLDLGSGRWARIDRDPAPSRRSGMACWVDPGGRFVLSGGRQGTTTLGDLWAASVDSAGGGVWTRLAASGAFAARSDAATTIHLDQAVLVSGAGADGRLLADAGTVGGSDRAITPLPAAGDGPAPRAGAVLVDDPAGERMLLLGGVTADGVTGDLWSAQLR